MAFRLTRLSPDPIVNPATGRPLNTFQRWWQSVCEAVEQQEAGQDSLISQLQAALTLSGAAVVGQDAAGATAKSDQATVTGLTINSSVFTLGPQVNLAGVTALMPNLTLTGSAPQSANSTGGPMDGEYRVQEIVGIAETTVFTGHFTVKTLNNGASVVTLSDPVNTQVFTRSATGSVSYRLDIRKTAGAGEADALSAYLFARRGP